MLNVNAKSGVKGVYSYKVTRQNGDIEEGKSNNMILDSILATTKQYGLYYSMSGYYINVGSGTTPVTAQDLGIQASLAPRTGRDSIVYSERFEGFNKFRKLTVTWTLPVGHIVGEVTEFSVDNDHGFPVSRVLIKDITGNPVSLTLTSLDQLTVNYEMEVEVPNFDQTTTLNLYGVDTQCRLVSVNMLDSIGATLHSVNRYQHISNNIRTFFEPITVTTAGETFLPANYPNNTYRDVTASTGVYENLAQQSVKNTTILQPNQCNGNIHAMGCETNVGGNTIFSLLMFNPPLPKTAADRVTIEVIISATMANV